MLILDGHRGRIYDIAFSPDGRLLASCGADRAVMLWDTQTCQRTARFVTTRNPLREMPRIAFTPDGSHLVARADEFGMLIFSVASLRRVLIVGPPSPAASPVGLAISPLGHLLITTHWVPAGYTFVLRRFNTWTW